MSEPGVKATEITELLEGVLHWTVLDDRLNFRSDGYAVRWHGTVVVIDPLPIADGLSEELGNVQAVCMTGPFHQRSCWSFRNDFGAPVYAPTGSTGLLEEPDETYGDPARLPGGLFASRRTGPKQPHFVFACEFGSSERVLFSGDLLIGEDDGGLRLVEEAYQDDVQATQEAVRSLLHLEPTTLCPAHGAPIIGDATAAIQKVVDGFATAEKPNGD